MSEKKSPYDSEVLEEQKKALYEKRNSLISKYQEWKDESKPSGLKEQGDIADIASEINEDMLSSALTQSEISTLNLVEEAIEKIENNTYGLCEGTGDIIPIARLKAIPWAKYTVQYSEQLSAKEKFNKKKPYNNQVGYSFDESDDS